MDSDCRHISRPTLKYTKTRKVSETYVPPWCKIQVYLLCRSKTCLKQVSKRLKYIKWTTEWFDLDLWTCDLLINRDHLLIGRSPCTEFGIDQTHWGQPLHQVWYWSSEGVKRYWADNTWSTDRPIDSYKTICPLFQGGHKY